MTDILGKIKTFQTASEILDSIEMIESGSYQENFSLQELRDRYFLDVEIFSDIQNIDEMREKLKDIKKVLTGCKKIEVTIPILVASDYFVNELHNIFFNHGYTNFLLKINHDDQNKSKVTYEVDGFYHEIPLSKVVKSFLLEVYAKK